MAFGKHAPGRLLSEEKRELQRIIQRLRYNHSIAQIAALFADGEGNPVSSNTVYTWLDRRGGTNKRLERARELASQEINDKREQLKEVGIC